MRPLAALALAATLLEPEIRAVRLTILDFRPALRILTSEGLGSAEVRREGEEVVIALAAHAPEDIALPSPEPPLEAIRLLREAGGVSLRVRVAPEVPFEVSREAGMITVAFGERLAEEFRQPISPDAYRRLFPTGVISEGRAAGGEQNEAARPRDAREGLALGPALLRPYVTASWVDADVAAFASPVPVRDQYLQLQPGIVASLPLLGGALGADYEPRLRYFSSIPEVGEASHFVNARLELPLGSRVELKAAHHWTRALLEVNEVDPGREYFFRLGRFTRNHTELGSRFDVGSRLSAELGGELNKVRFEAPESAGFFDYDARTLRAGLGYEVGADRRLSLTYAHDRVPPAPRRELVDSSAHSLGLELRGEIGPLLSGQVAVAYRSQSNPGAEAGGKRFRGLTAAAALRRELGRASWLALTLRRSTDLSAFEGNAFYVSSAVELTLSLPAPLGCWLRGGAGRLWNDYRTAASAIGEPRADEIFGWSVGLGRQLGYRSYVRVDYRRERRDSNLPGFNVTTSGLVLQLGLGFFVPEAARP